MAVVIITGSSGLIGSQSVKYFAQKGFDVVGIDNNMRQYFFGKDGSTEWNTKKLKNEIKNFHHFDLDIRDQIGIDKIFEKYANDIKLVVHTAAQPSHDWAAKEPFTDFTINANGTLVLLEATRKFCSDAVFIFTSTNKVYGDRPNTLPLVELETRWEIDSNHPFFDKGIDETMSIDQSKHSVFGASKVAADILVQEYGRYFNLKTGVFRGGCLTGPAHSGAELHGFLAYLVKCVVSQREYTVFGYKGKQVRDNIHAYDLVNAFDHFFKDPKPGSVYNMGGSRHSHSSMIEAIQIIQEICSKELKYTISDQSRIGDHIWYVSDVSSFQKDYPSWQYQYDLNAILKEIIDVALDNQQVKL